MTTIDKQKPYEKDFRNFLWKVWKHLNLPNPTELQYDIALYLMTCNKRTIIEAFRGVGKSWITSAYVCWLLLTDPQRKILVVSASKDRADAFSTFTKRLINEMPELQHLAPRFGQRDSNIAFDVAPAQPSHAPSVKSVGITGQITGSRADVIIADDIETPKNSLTQLMRDRLSELIKEFDAVLTPKPDSKIIYLGTPQTEMSVYNVLPERGYEMRIWTARIPEKPEMYQDRLAPIIQDMIDNGNEVNSPTDPARFDEFDLMEREASYGRSGFALQFMLDTSLSDADRYPLKLSDLIVMDVDNDKAPIKVAWSSAPDLIDEGLPVVGLAGDRYYKPMYIDEEWAEYTGAVLVIDPSGRGKDETSYCVIKILNGMLFLVDMGGFAGGYSETTLETLARIAKKYKVNDIATEQNFGDGMFDQLLKPYLQRIYPVGMNQWNDGKGIRQNIQKEKRIIDTLEPIMNQHKLIVNRRLIEEDYSKASHPNYQLFYQMTRLTRERGALVQDDRIDVVSMGVAYWVEHMSRDSNKAAEEHKASLLDRELERFMEHAIGVKQGSSTWM